MIHHGDETARQAWQQTPSSSRLNYLTEFAPGTVLEKPSSGLPEVLLERNLTAEESESGWQNFALIETTISRFDWLHLTTRGHRRVEFVWTGEDFIGHWLTP
jgi:3-hydroxyisobutyrate dehydrogenase